MLKTLVFPGARSTNPEATEKVIWLDQESPFTPLPKFNCLMSSVKQGIGLKRGGQQAFQSH